MAATVGWGLIGASNEGQPSASGEDGVRSLAVALAVLESARTGKRVEIRYR